MSVKTIGVTATCMLCAFGATFLFSISAHAALLLTTSAPTLLPGPDNLVQYTLYMDSTGAEVIDGFTFASVTPISGLGVHQVWAPIIDLPTPTQQTHLNAGPLWSDAWTPYDTFYFPTDNNSIKTPGELLETITGTGAALPSAGFGVPDTGYGSITSPLSPPPPGPGGLSLPVAYAYTLASGLQGKHVPLMQVVIRAQDEVQVNAHILTTTGNNGDAVIAIGVPEPAAFTLCALAVAFCGGFARRR